MEWAWRPRLRHINGFIIFVYLTQFSAINRINYQVLLEIGTAQISINFGPKIGDTRASERGSNCGIIHSQCLKRGNGLIRSTGTYFNIFIEALNLLCDSFILPPVCQLWLDILSWCACSNRSGAGFSIFSRGWHQMKLKVVAYFFKYISSRFCPSVCLHVFVLCDFFEGAVLNNSCCLCDNKVISQPEITPCVIYCSCVCRCVTLFLPLSVSGMNAGSRCSSKALKPFSWALSSKSLCSPIRICKKVFKF